jgi:lysozyme
MDKMKKMISYQDFNENQIYQYIDSLILLNEEKLTFEKIKEKCLKVLDRIKNLPLNSKRKFLIYFISSLLTISSADMVYQAVHSTKDPVAISVVDQKVKEEFKDPLTLHISKKGVEHIKKEESLKLRAYELGDGKITVGWGHAEDLGTSKLREDQKITIDMAKRYLHQDLKEAEDAVKRIFKDWQNKGIDRKITQDQFDAMVSMTYNMGIGSVRKSEFIQHVKSGDYETAGKSISKTNISDRFPGLEKRRSKESKMFLSYLVNI